jgi:hypothetical protein
LKLAKDIAELKAVSQDLMHANFCTMDGVYGMLSDMDVREQIGSLGQRIAQGDNQDIATLNEFVKQLEK